MLDRMVQSRNNATRERYTLLYNTVRRAYKLQGLDWRSMSSLTQAQLVPDATRSFIHIVALNPTHS